MHGCILICSHPVTIQPTAKPWLQALMSGANLAGATAYTMIDNHLYLEAGAYSSQSRYMAQGLGVWNLGSQSSNPQSGLIDGAAPYWRVFLQHNSGPHMMMIGTFGLMAKVIPYLSARLRYRLLSGIQYRQQLFLYARRRPICWWRWPNIRATIWAWVPVKGMGAATNSFNYLNSIMVMGMWTHKQT